ncbi:hypothetical protein HYQ44_017849 [Verticillium longisporum]|nr:hypothetical protein HYQ44_017849 [Verticillium longisporum]
MAAPKAVVSRIAGRLTGMPIKSDWVGVAAEKVAELIRVAQGAERVRRPFDSRRSSGRRFRGWRSRFGIWWMVFTVELVAGNGAAVRGRKEERVSRH